MALVELIDELDALITERRPLSEIKPILILLRDQVDALERDHATLQASHAELIQEKSSVDRELSEMKAAKAKMEAERRETFGMGDLGQML